MKTDLSENVLAVVVDGTFHINTDVEFGGMLAAYDVFSRLVIVQRDPAGWGSRSTPTALVKYRGQLPRRHCRLIGDGDDHAIDLAIVERKGISI